MYFEKESGPHHSGTETYSVTFSLKEQDDLYDTRGFGVQFTFRPEKVTLVWERDRNNSGYEPWRRVGYWARGPWSGIAGPRVLKDGSTSDKQQGVAQVFASYGKLSEYAASLPHLEQMIEELEKQLPA